jgi:hypothetical protein
MACALELKDEEFRAAMQDRLDIILLPANAVGLRIVSQVMTMHHLRKIV